MKQLKKLPGPGKYDIGPPSKKTVTKKIDFAEESKKPGTRYIDKLIKDKQKIPGVGKYNPEVDHTEEIRRRCKVFGDRARKEAPLFKFTIFDDNQRDLVNVGPGLYEQHQSFGENKSFRIQAEFESNKGEEDPKDKDKKVKKVQSLTKLPSVHSYTPIHQNY